MLRIRGLPLLLASAQALHCLFFTLPAAAQTASALPSPSPGANSISPTITFPPPAWESLDDDLLDDALDGSAAPDDPGDDFSALSLDDLMNIEVVTVSKRAQSLFHTAAAVTVLRGEDIRRSGVRSIPEALRMVAGIHVASVNSNIWSISIRGFPGRFANKLLVLIDGRSVYTPLFSGTFWSLQDYTLEDIERIEVIRGPGATLWGTNAVSGIINVITKSSADTQGTYVEAGAGPEERGFGSIRHGGRLGETAAYRAYVKYFNRDSFAHAAHGAADDSWTSLRGGVRLDWQPTPEDSFILLADTTHLDAGTTLDLPSLTPPFNQLTSRNARYAGSNLLMRWNHATAEDSRTTAQAYFDHYRLDDPLLDFRWYTLDLDMQHQFSLGDRHMLVAGAGYRLYEDNTDNNFTVSFANGGAMLELFSAFIQDRVSLVPDRLHLTVGSKLEHNDFTGLEFQPSIRALWAPTDSHSVWAAVTRAVRTPSRVDHDVEAKSPGMLDTGTGLPLFPAFEGDSGFRSETMVATELGYRAQPTEEVAVELATFWNVYDDLRTAEPGAPILRTAPTPHLVLPFRFDNERYGSTYGLELSSHWSPAPRWRLSAGYQHFQNHLKLRSSSNDTVTTDDRSTPGNGGFLLSRLDLRTDLQLDASAYYVDRIESPRVGAYVRLDARLAWKPREAVELSVVGQNLLDGEHQEMASASTWTQYTKPQRSVFASLTLRF